MGLNVSEICLETKCGHMDGGPDGQTVRRPDIQGAANTRNRDFPLSNPI